jgi:peptidoglycan-associated lipoprotein
MLKRVSFYAVAVFPVAMFMIAGCATQDVVKKDVGLVPGAVVKQTVQPKAGVTPPKQDVTTPVSQVTPLPAPVQQANNGTSAARLQSALEKIYFDFDSASLSESARAALAKNAALLQKVSSAKVSIEGNCDERGSAEYNLALGERRAKAAQQYLITSGVKPDRLSVISYGKEKPAVQGGTESAWAKNRRDEFVILP